MFHTDPLSPMLCHTCTVAVVHPEGGLHGAARTTTAIGMALTAAGTPPHLHCACMVAPIRSCPVRAHVSFNASRGRGLGSPRHWARHQLTPRWRGSPVNGSSTSSCNVVCELRVRTPNGALAVWARTFFLFFPERFLVFCRTAPYSVQTGECVEK